MGLRLAGASAAMALLFGAALAAAPSSVPLAHATVASPAAAPTGLGAPDLASAAPPEPPAVSGAVAGPSLADRPDPYALWRRQLAEDPAQAVMPVRSWCPTAPTLRALAPVERYAIALRRRHERTPSKAGFETAVAAINDIRDPVMKVFPRSFGYDPSDDTNSKVVDIGTQVHRLVLHYTEGPRRDLGGYAHAKLIANMGTGVGYNYYINDIGASSQIFHTSGEFVHHVKGLNAGAFGVEVAGCSQAGITPRQWENLLYLVAHFMASNSIITADAPVTAIVNSFVVGHRELAGPLAHPDFPKVIAEPFRRRLIAFLVQELGFAP